MRQTSSRRHVASVAARAQGGMALVKPEFTDSASQKLLPRSPMRTVMEWPMIGGWRVLSPAAVHEPLAYAVSVMEGELFLFTLWTCWACDNVQDSIITRGNRCQRPRCRECGVTRIMPLIRRSDFNTWAGWSGAALIDADQDARAVRAEQRRLRAHRDVLLAEHKAKVAESNLRRLHGAPDQART